MISVLLLFWSLAQNPAPDEFRQAFASAQALLEQGKTAEAATRLEQVVRGWPREPEPHFSLGVCYSQAGRISDAAASLRRYVTLDPKSADGHTVLGLLLTASGDLTAAQAELERALALDAGETEALKGLARVQNLRGDSKRALELLARLGPPAKLDGETRALVARTMFASGDNRGSAALLDGLLASEPASAPEIYVQAASAYLRLGRPEDAAGICERGLRIHPNSERLELFYAALPKETLLPRIFRRLAELKPRGDVQPSDLPELLALGRLLTDVEGARANGGIDTAEKLLERAVEVAPKDPAAWYNLGRCRVLLWKTEEAIPTLRKALELAPDPPMRVMALALIGEAAAYRLRSTGEDDPRADEAFRTSLELNRKLPTPLAEAAFEYYKYLVERSRPEAAAAVLAEIQHWEPFYAPALLEHAKVLGDQDQWRKAADEGEIVVRNTEDTQLLRSAHVFLARAYHVLGDTERSSLHMEWVKAHHTSTNAPGK